MKSKLKAIYFEDGEDKEWKSFLSFISRTFHCHFLFIVYFHMPADEHIECLVIEQYAPC